MVRTTPPDRLEKIVAVSAAAFVEQGYQRTQMDHIALRMGVSKGTLYRSVESKESLLAAVLTYADKPEHIPGGGPLPSVNLDELSRWLRDELSGAGFGLALTAATKRQPADDIGAEIERLAEDLYEMMAAHRVRIMVLDRVAPELTELAGDWYSSGRYVLVDLWENYLRSRAADITSVDLDALARTIVELITLWAVKMPWDPAPRPYPTNMAAQCAAMVRNLVTGDNT